VKKWTSKVERDIARNLARHKAKSLNVTQSDGDVTIKPMTVLILVALAMFGLVHILDMVAGWR